MIIVIAHKMLLGTSVLLEWPGKGNNIGTVSV